MFENAPAFVHKSDEHQEFNSSKGIDMGVFDYRRFVRGCYQLPGDPARDEYIIPCSGGADSTALTIMMHAVFPDAPLRMVFTDTLADEVEIYETLDKLEAFLGKKIDRIVPKKGLYELVEQYNGFLPSSRDRWCTKTLKLKPFEHYMGYRKPIMGGQIWSFVGIRADEPWRSGLVSGDDDIHTELPYKAWGVNREDVFRILDETIGIPRYYQRRTRSGCYSCWGMRRAETVGLLDAHPVEFWKAASYEKLSDKDKAKQRDVISVPEELGIGRNWTGFPIPRDLDIRNPETQKNVFSKWVFHDLRLAPSGNNVIPFPIRYWEGDQQPSSLSVADEENRLWVGVEFHIDPGIGGDGVFWQQIVTFSRTRGGLSRQLQGWYEHRLQTAEASGLTPDEVRDHVKFATYCIQAKSSDMDTESPSEGSFTWKGGESYEMIARLTKFAVRTLNAARIEQDARIARVEGNPGKVARLQIERGRITEPVGKVVSMNSYVAREPAENEVEDEHYAPCFACSI